MKKIDLFVVDPQHDFCDPTGALFVQGADSDMGRLVKMIDKYGDKLNDIHVSLDSHSFNHIAHPNMWVDANGKHPNPFTVISVTDVKNGVWNPTLPQLRNRFLDYVKMLEQNNRYVLCIWTPHCLIGSTGHKVYAELYESLLRWEEKETAWVNYITKGSNPFTEHYSLLLADVPDPKDCNTQLNTELIDTLKKADVVLVAGEALSHCVCNSVTDLANNFGEDNIKKIVLLQDATSNVTGFEALGEKFVKDMTARGMQISTTVDFFKGVK